jgi:hypothetical protein
LIREELVSTTEKEQVRHWVQKINKALLPALTVKYGEAAAKTKLLKLP